MFPLTKVNLIELQSFVPVTKHYLFFFYLLVSSLELASHKLDKTKKNKPYLFYWCVCEEGVSSHW